MHVFAGARLLGYSLDDEHEVLQHLVALLDLVVEAFLLVVHTLFLLVEGFQTLLQGEISSR